MSEPMDAPSYIPPHLAEATDFRDEGNGNLSFSHPGNYKGLAPYQSRIVLGPEQANNTFNEVHRMSNKNEALKGQFNYERPHGPGGIPQAIQDWMVGKARNAYNWGTSSRGKATGTGGLLGALAAGGLGLWQGSANGGSGIGRGLLYALLGGGAGLAATMYGQHKADQNSARMDKSASEDVTQALILAVNNDYMLSRSDKSDLLRGMAKMQQQDRDTLYRLIRISIGAGAGKIIGNFLKAKGLLPTILGGILGAMVGGFSGPKTSYNQLGQVSTSNYR